MEGTLFSKIPMCKYYFQNNFLFKNNLLEKVLKPPFFADLSSDFKQRYFFHEKNCNIDYSSSPPYLTDVKYFIVNYYFV